MNRISRLVVASCAGVALAFTASPALAAHTDDGNGAHVEQRELVFLDGTYEYHQVVRHHGDYYNTTNTRDQWTYVDGDIDSFDWKQHNTELENVQVSSGQTKSIDGDRTCRTNSVSITVTTAKGQMSKGKTQQSSECPVPPISE